MNTNSGFMKTVLSVIFSAFIFSMSAVMPSDAVAQTSQPVDVNRCVINLRTARTMYYRNRDTAEQNMIYELRQGNCVKLYYAGRRRGWAVASQAKTGYYPGTVTVPVPRTNPDVPAGRPNNLPAKARVYTFFDKRVADSTYENAIRSGRWARMWREGGKWAVAIVYKYQ